MQPAAAISPPPARRPIALGLRFIGIVETTARGHRVAVLANDRSVHYGQVGDILLGRFRVLAFDDISVELEELPGGSRTTLRVGAGGESRGSE